MTTDSQTQQLINAASPMQREMLSESGAVIEKLDTPFWKEHHLYQLSRLKPEGPEVHYLVLSPDGSTHDVTGDGETFAALTSATDLLFEEHTAVLAYYNAAMRATLKPSALTYPVEKIEDVKWARNLDHEERRRKIAATEEMRRVLEPAKARPELATFVVTGYRMEDRDLVRYRAAVEKDGSWQETTETILRDLPVIFDL